MPLNCTDKEERLLRALEALLAMTSDESQHDQKTDVRLREEFRAVRESCELTASALRDKFTVGA
jgi:hypothetical protein